MYLRLLKLAKNYPENSDEDLGILPFIHAFRDNTFFVITTIISESLITVLCAREFQKIILYNSNFFKIAKNRNSYVHTIIRGEKNYTFG